MESLEEVETIFMFCVFIPVHETKKLVSSHGKNKLFHSFVPTTYSDGKKNCSMNTKEY